jgi:hypothetical protein
LGNSENSAILAQISAFYAKQMTSYVGFFKDTLEPHFENFICPKRQSFMESGKYVLATKTNKNGKYILATKTNKNGKYTYRYWQQKETKKLSTVFQSTPISSTMILIHSKEGPSSTRKGTSSW